MIGKEWKELPAEKQKIFLDRANAAKERYNKENNIYLAKKKKDEEQKIV